MWGIEMNYNLFSEQSLQEVTISPIRPYGGPQMKSPNSPQMPKRLVHKQAEDSFQTSVDAVGELFNFTQPANLAPKFAAAGPLPAELPAWTHQRMYLNGRFLYNVSHSGRAGHFPFIHSLLEVRFC